MSDSNDHAILGNYADLDYSGEYEYRDCEDLPGGTFEVLKIDGKWYWTSWEVDNDNNDCVGPFDTSAEAYHDAQGF